MYSAEPLGLQAKFAAFGVSSISTMPYLESLGILVSDSTLYLSTSIDSTQTKTLTINNMDALPCNLTNVEVINVSGVTTDYTPDLASASEIALTITYSPLIISNDNGFIRLFFNNGSNIIDVKLSVYAYYLNIIEQSTVSIDFGKVSLGTHLVTVTNLTNLPVTMESPQFMNGIGSTSYLFKVFNDVTSDQLTSDTIPPYGSYVLRITFEAPFPKVYRDILTIKVSNAETTRVLQLSIRGDGNVSNLPSQDAELVYQPVYPVVVPNEAIKLFLKATNYESTTLHVDSYSFEGLHATDTCTVDFVNSLLVTTIPPYSEIAVSVTYTPSTSELHLPTLILSGARD